MMTAVDRLRVKLIRPSSLVELAAKVKVDPYLRKGKTGKIEPVVGHMRGITLESPSVSGGKFWRSQVEGTKVRTTFGKVKTPGQSKEFAFPSEAEAKSYFERKVREKRAKGYAESPESGSPLESLEKKVKGPVGGKDEVPTAPTIPKLPKKIAEGYGLYDKSYAEQDLGSGEPGDEADQNDVYAYQGSYLLNRKLRDGKKLDSNEQRVTDTLDRLMKKFPKLDQHYQLYRGAEMPVELRKMKPDELVGATWTEKAFTSTTPDPESAMGYVYKEGENIEGHVQGPAVLMEIIAAPGTGWVGMPMDEEMDEDILQRNLKYTVLEAIEKVDKSEHGVGKYTRLKVLAEPA